MKKIYTLLAAFCALSTTSNAQYGFWADCGSDLNLSINGTATHYNPSPCPNSGATAGNAYNGGVAFQGATLTNVSSLLLTSAGANTYQNNNGNAQVTSAVLEYRIYPASQSPAPTTFATYSLGGAAINGTNNNWTTTSTVNLLSGLLPNTTYKMEVWYHGTTAGANSFYNSNNSANYVMTFTTASVLPVKFTGINADLNGKNTAQVNWDVASEVDVKDYTLQKSANGVDFTDVTTVLAKGAPKYFAYDNKVFNGANIYRVKANDFDGRVTFSNTVAVKGDLGNSVILLQNPVSNIVRLRNLAVGSVVRISDNFGRTLQNWKAAGINEDRDVSNLPSGFYTIQVMNNGNNQAIKFVK